MNQLAPSSDAQVQCVLPVGPCWMRDMMAWLKRAVACPARSTRSGWAQLVGRSAFLGRRGKDQSEHGTLVVIVQETGWTRIDRFGETHDHHVHGRYDKQGLNRRAMRCE